MFLHAGPRPLWPVIVFLPWFLLGFAYLLESLLRRVSQPPAGIIRGYYSALRRLKAWLLHGPTPG